MTQTSRPTAQHIDNYPDGDSGPYSSLQWRMVFKTLWTADDDQGPVAGYLNDLAPSNPAGKTVRIATGAAIVGGNVFFNDANVDFSPPNPTTGPRYDYVVACLNDTDTAMTVSDAGHTLAFPTDLTDYNSASSIPPYSCRLVIVRGVENGGYPTLDQNDDHYMIPLSSYLISTLGVLSSQTDRREHIRQRSFFVPALRGYNTTTSTEIDLDIYNKGSGAFTLDGDLCVGIPLNNTDNSYAVGQFVIPDDYASRMYATPIVVSTASGDAYIETGRIIMECGSASYSFAGTETVETVCNECTDCLTARRIDSSLWGNPGERVCLYTGREGGQASDTLLGYIYVTGWNVTYNAKA